MRALISVTAAANHRSMHSEIIKRLNCSFSQDDHLMPGIGSDEGQELSIIESGLIKSFRQLTAKKQQALLGLLLNRKDSVVMEGCSPVLTAK
jgi:imidazoleglycerol phosphate synthase glutamine amidotransferase subunit HisH